MSQSRATTHIEASNGHAPGFESICHAQFGKEVWQQFSLDKGVLGQRRPGRPAKQDAKRLRYDAWHAYVARSKPRSEAQKTIRVGSHMRELSAKRKADLQHIQDTRRRDRKGIG